MKNLPEGTREQTPEEVRRLGPVPIFTTGDAVPGLNSWVLDHKLGGGGFGEVWLARHAFDAEQKPRAVKFCTDPAARHRLVTHERNVVVRVMKYAGRHPNIVPLLEYNLDGAVPWLMYEFVEGGTLASLVERWRDLPLSKRLGRAVKALHAVAGALAACHRLDPPLVHRDMKPHNVLMAGTVPRITDFGIGSVAFEPGPEVATGALTALEARIPSVLQGAGTRFYAPPEQMFGGVPSPREDVYALGIIAYQLVTADLMSVPGADAALELRDWKVPDELASLIVRSVAMNAERRPKDAGEWEAALSAIIRRHKQQSASTDTGSPSKPFLIPDPPEPEPLPMDLPNENVPLAKRLPKQNQKPFRRSWPWLTFGCAGLLLAVCVPAVVLALRPANRVVAPVNPTSQRERDSVNSKPETPPKPGDAIDIEIANGVKMRFCWVPAGECQLGSPQTELNRRSDEVEEKRSTFKTTGFWMGKYEVTQAEWAAVMRGATHETPSDFRIGGKQAERLGSIKDTTRFPVECVSWNMICKPDGFLSRVNAFARDPHSLFRLPHEDEWEYACRGGRGNKPAFYFGSSLNGTQANCDGTNPFGTTTKGACLERPTAVGSYESIAPHPWGLCDTHGNVWEWCENLYNKEGNCVLRGGSWNRFPDGCRAAYRNGDAPASRINDYGFRVCFRPD